MSNPWWDLPNPDSVLDSPFRTEQSPNSLRAKVRDIEQALRSLDVLAVVVAVNSGPRETEFILEPAPYGYRRQRSKKFSFNRVKSRAKDLAAALAVPYVSVELAVSGQRGVAVWVPNQGAKTVSLRDAIESKAFSETPGHLRLALGKNAHGSALVINLRELPHLLIGGTVHSGKSVCLQSIVASLLLQNTPDTLRFLMVDTKGIELTCYNDIPHLMSPIITDAGSVISSLRDLWNEARDRQGWFQDAGYRDIDGFNRDDLNSRRIELHRPCLPYIVVVMDEILDVALEFARGFEDELDRLVRVGRAVGIHFVVATGRPSLPVLTPRIKSTFGGRIAFKMATKGDSRTILDGGNAEKLEGKGDMFCRMPGLNRLVRAQAVLVSDNEVDRLVGFWRDAAQL